VALINGAEPAMSGVSTFRAVRGGHGFDESVEQLARPIKLVVLRHDGRLASERKRSRLLACAGRRSRLGQRGSPA
jgi:hypothetical protein